MVRQKEIFNYAPEQLLTLKKSTEGIIAGLQRTIQYLMGGRMLITIILCAWLITLSYLITRKSDTQNPDDKTDPSRMRYYNLHRVWFGDQSPLLILLKLWYYTFVLILLAPVIRELITFLKLRVEI